MEKIIEQVLIGSLFGDGGLERNRSTSKGIKKVKPVGIRFKERHNIRQKEYLLWKKEILSKILTIKEYYSKKERAIVIYSNVSPLFKKYHFYFYPSGKGHKVFDLYMLNKLKPLGLAIWYMDDGHFDKRNYNFTLSCNNNSLDLLKSWFKEKYNMKGNIYFGKEAKIHFNKKDTKSFFKIISPFIYPTMKYKIKRTKIEINKARRYARNYQRGRAKSDKQK